MHAERAGWSSDQVARAVGSGSGSLPRVDFVSEAERCLSCDGDVGTLKSRTRIVLCFEQGAFEAKEVLKQCKAGAACPTIRSEALRRLVPPRQRYAYDLIVRVGLQRYLGARQRDEIRATLRETRGIKLSAGTVSNLCDRFLLMLERLHLHRAPALRDAMEGGYPMHLDATCEGGRGGLFVVMDGWRGWVLGATRIPGEREEELRPLVDKTAAIFGEPLATVRDLGDGVEAAVRALRERGVPDLACHYHFLKNVGAKLLNGAYSGLRHALDQTHVRGDLRALLRQLRRYCQSDGYQGRLGVGNVREELAALVLWLLEGEGRKDQVFPFSLPHVDLVRRIEQVVGLARQWAPAPHSEPERRALQKLRELPRRVHKRAGINETLRRLDEGWQAFCELRDVLRLSDAELPRADLRYRQQHLPQLELLRLKEIERDLLRYKLDLEQRAGNGNKQSPSAVILSYLQTYGVHLFGHPARRDDDGTVIAVVPRTNNPVEHLFGNEKQRLRRRLGRAHLARDLQQQPAQAALVANLTRPDYVRVLCGSLDNLASAFASLDGVNIAGTTPLHRDHRDHQHHRRIRQLIGSSGDRVPLSSRAQTDDPSPQAEQEPKVRLADVEGLTKEQLRARCGEVFVHQQRPSSPNAGASNTRPQLKPKREPTQRIYPLGKLAGQIIKELVRAGYSRSTSTLSVYRTQAFANFHMRSPADMGGAEVAEYLLHLADNTGLQLRSWRGYRYAILLLYAVVLRRPQEVENIPTHPDKLRLLAAERPLAA